MSKAIDLIRRNKKKIFLVLFIAVLVMVRFSRVGDSISIENLKKNRELLQAAVQARYLLSALVFIAVYIVVAGLSIPGAEIVTLCGGFLYGVPAATLYVNIGATAGATFAFLSARYLAGNWLQKKYERQLSVLNYEIERNGARYLLTLRLIPVFPFFLINILSGLTKVPLKTFVWTTALGIIPGTAVYAYAGRQIVSLNSAAEILSPRVVAAFAILALFAVVPALYGRLTSKHSRPKG